MMAEETAEPLMDIQPKAPKATADTGLTEPGAAKERKKRKDAGQPHAKRTAKKGKASRPRPALDESLTVEALTQQIVGGHQLLAVWVPGAGISEPAARAEAEAMRQILDIYGMEWMERVWPWVSLGMAVAIGELPTAMAVAALIKSKKEAAPTTAPAKGSVRIVGGEWRDPGGRGETEHGRGFPGEDSAGQPE